MSQGGAIGPLRVASQRLGHACLTIRQPRGCAGTAKWRSRSCSRRRASPLCGRCVDALPAVQHADRRSQRACSSRPAATLPPAPQVETKTRHEIEQKKQQLRQVVGDSYRQAWVPRRRLRLRPSVATP